MSDQALCVKSRKSSFKETLRRMFKDRVLYLLLIPAILDMLIFSYGPMPGIIMAFQEYSIYDGLFGSEWVGLSNFLKIFQQSKFLDAVWNTFYSNILCLVTGFGAPIVLALLLNELRNKHFKKITQTISYLPHFLSWISVVGIVQLLFARDGLINDFRVWLGAEERIAYLGVQEYFIWFIVFIPFWKGLGWSTVIHLADLTSINPELYEAAELDGANYFQKLRYITLPHMLPTCVILLIFNIGGLFSSNFELVYGLQNPYIDFEVISTVEYLTGLQNGNYSMSAAIGLLNGLVALLLVIGTDKLSKKVSGTGIF